MTTYSWLRTCDTVPTRSPLRVVDADLRAHVATGVEREHLDVPVDRAHVAQLLGLDPRFVVVRHDDHARLHRRDHPPERIRHQSTPVEHALGRVVARVDALARDPVVLGGVPRDQRLPHVVVGEVPVLVVRRIEVGEVARRQRGGHVERVAADRHAGAGEELGDPQRQRRRRSRRPLLHVRHLHAGGGVDPVGGLEQAGEQDRVVGRARVLALDRIADGVDPRTVERLEEARLLAERLGEVARRARPRVQVVDHRREIDEIDRARVGLDVRASEHLRVARSVDCGDPRAGALERLRDARRAGEEIERGARLGRLAQSGEHRHQAALRPEVLDHQVA